MKTVSHHELSSVTGGAMTDGLHYDCRRSVEKGAGIGKVAGWAAGGATGFVGSLAYMATHAPKTRLGGVAGLGLWAGSTWGGAWAGMHGGEYAGGAIAKANAAACK